MNSNIERIFVTSLMVALLLGAFFPWPDWTTRGASTFHARKILYDSSPIRGDLDADGTVDIFDIVIVALEFGRPPPPIEDTRADVNKDGVVDIFDIAIVAIHFGENSVAGEHFGDQVLFWINTLELVQMRATLLAVGSWSYIYMANETIELLGESFAISKCEALSDEFDLTIYPKAIEVAGSPDGNLGDIDGDPHVTIFLAPLVRRIGDNSVLGYYDGKDDDPYNPYSNLREMVYVDSEHSLQDTYCIIAHELNHMIWGNYESDEAEFLSEGSANYAVDFCGYNSWVTDAVASTFTSHPEIPLLYFVREYGALWDASYGQAYLLSTYLANRFGNDFIRELVSTAADGAKSLDVVLSLFGYNLRFNDIYLDWITACTLDDTTFADGIYGFETVDYQVLTPIIGYFPIEKHDVKHYYYGFDVKRIYGGHDNFIFAIENPFPYALGISIALFDDNGWNVTQVFNTENSERIYLHVEGENIQKAYVITSLMSPNTPSDFGIIYNLDEVPSESLDYSFY